jgi:hypothetical protein
MCTGTARPHDYLMTHITITQCPANWGDHVTDAEYGRGG